MFMIPGLFLLLFATLGATLWVTTVPAVDRFLRKGHAAFLPVLWTVTLLIMYGAASAEGYEEGSLIHALMMWTLCLAPLASAILSLCWRDLSPREGGKPPESPIRARQALAFILPPAAGALLAGIGHLLDLGTWDELAVPAFFLCVMVMQPIEKRMASRDVAKPDGPARPATPEPQLDPMDLLIVWDAGGTHADVRPAGDDAPVPRGAHRLRPDEEHYGIPYRAWRARVGRTVDVCALQNSAHTHAGALTFSTRAPETPRITRDLPAYAPPRSSANHPPPVRRAPPVHWAHEEEIAMEEHRLSDYGYHTGAEARPCTLPELVAQCTTVPATPLVWTPAGAMRPEAVPFLADELARHRMQRAHRDLWVCAAGLAVGLAVYAINTPRLGQASMLLLLPAFMAVGLAGALYARREAKRTDAQAFPAARAWARHEEWVKAQPAHYTKVLLGLLVVIYLAQMFARRSVPIELVGLVKPAVWNGEAWRLLTAALLHVNGAHLWMNGAALLATGRLVEVHSRRDHLPLVFLVSALAGSVASLLLYPNVTSVGASGGLMGLIGFLLVLGYRRRDALPPGFAGTILFSIAATAVLGLVGFALIDNAAHLGGLLAGVALGRILERRGVIDPGRSASTRMLGYLAAAVLLAGAVWSLMVMFAR